MQELEKRTTTQRNTILLLLLLLEEKINRRLKLRPVVLVACLLSYMKAMWDLLYVQLLQEVILPIYAALCFVSSFGHHPFKKIQRKWQN